METKRSVLKEVSVLNICVASFLLLPSSLTSSINAVEGDSSPPSDSTDSHEPFLPPRGLFHPTLLTSMFHIQFPAASASTSCSSQLDGGNRSTYCEEETLLNCHSCYPKRANDILEKMNEFSLPPASFRQLVSSSPLTYRPNISFSAPSSLLLSSLYSASSSSTRSLLCRMFSLATISLSDAKSAAFPSSIPTTVSMSSLDVKSKQSTDSSHPVPSPDCVLPWHSQACKVKGCRSEEGMQTTSNSRCTSGRGSSSSSCFFSSCLQLLLPLFQLHFSSACKSEDGKDGSLALLDSQKSLPFLSSIGKRGIKSKICKLHSTSSYTSERISCKGYLSDDDGENHCKSVLLSSIPQMLVHSFSLWIPAGWVFASDAFFSSRIQGGAMQSFDVGWLCGGWSSFHIGPFCQPSSSFHCNRFTTNKKKSASLAKWAASQEEDHFQIGIPISAEKLNEWMNFPRDSLCSSFDFVKSIANDAPLPFSLIRTSCSENREIISFLFPAFHHHQFFQSLEDFECHYASSEHRTHCSHFPLIPLHRCMIPEQCSSANDHLPFPSKISTGGLCRDAPCSIHIITNSRSGPNPCFEGRQYYPNGTISDKGEPSGSQGEGRDDEGVFPTSSSSQPRSNVMTYSFSSVRAHLILDLFSRFKEDLNGLFSHRSIASSFCGSGACEEEASSLSDRAPPHLWNAEEQHYGANSKLSFLEKECLKDDEKLDKWRKVVLPHTLASRVAVLVVDEMMRGGPTFLSVQEPTSSCLSLNGQEPNEENSLEEGKNPEQYCHPLHSFPSSLLLTPPDELIVEVEGRVEYRTGKWTMSSYSAVPLPGVLPDSHDPVAPPMSWSSWPSMTRWLSLLFPRIWRAVLYEIIYGIRGIRIHPAITIFPTPFTKWDEVCFGKARTVSSCARSSTIPWPHIPEEEIRLWDNSSLVPEIIAILAKKIVIFVREAEMHERFSLLRANANRGADTITSRKRRREKDEIDDPCADLDEDEKILCCRKRSSSLPLMTRESIEKKKEAWSVFHPKPLGKKNVPDIKQHRSPHRERERIDEANNDFYYLMAELVMSTSLDSS